MSAWPEVRSKSLLRTKVPVPLTVKGAEERRRTRGGSSRTDDAFFKQRQQRLLLSALYSSYYCCLVGSAPTFRGGVLFPRCYHVVESLHPSSPAPATGSPTTQVTGGGSALHGHARAERAQGAAQLAQGCQGIHLPPPAGRAEVPPPRAADLRVYRRRPG